MTAKHAAPKRHPPVVIVADDHLDAREMYCMYLTHLGIDCIEASDGAEVIRLARQRTPALILMDAAMPVLDGWEATAALKADPDLKHIPVVMVTAHAFHEHRERAEKVGADEFIAKPVLPDALAVIVRRWLGGR